jgi:hypothetical protein
MRREDDSQLLASIPQIKFSLCIQTVKTVKKILTQT